MSTVSVRCHVTKKIAQCEDVQIGVLAIDVLLLSSLRLYNVIQVKPVNLPAPSISAPSQALKPTRISSASTQRTSHCDDRHISL